MVVSASSYGDALVHQAKGSWMELNKRFSSRVVLLEAAGDLRLGWRSSFQQDNHPKQPARDPMRCFRSEQVLISMGLNFVNQSFAPDYVNGLVKCSSSKLPWGMSLQTIDSLAKSIFLLVKTRIFLPLHS
ncbi:hypothetical protein CHARACLAT_001496 [Characodon lateralis]|uniref:Uncharacterized protein n=1 Tax=Characodon lateralis TaxID=208331 RepID=A0ABU7DD65_9TELE|nr:hypothetical protein [Characodon lateralis]